jgi:predicted GTPase
MSKHKKVFESVQRINSINQNASIEETEEHIVELLNEVNEILIVDNFEYYGLTCFSG